jgi:hypothetical protein
VELQNLLQNKIFRPRHRNSLLHIHFSCTHLLLSISFIPTTLRGAHSSSSPFLFFPPHRPLPPTPRPLSPTPPPRLLRRCIGAEPRSSARRRIEAEPRSRAEDEDEGRAGHGAPVCIDRGPGGTQSRARPTSTR